MLEITHKPESPGITIILKGHLDAVTAPQLEKQLDDLFRAEHAHIVVDLGCVAFVASAGLRVFLACAKKARRAQRGLALCRLQPQVQQVFELAGMTPLFLIHLAPENAHAALRQRSAAA
ncbi:MAG: STAS domain-containing protein [Verrucomicrobia bacterium]|nr:STAS domain-containing protein [Verrucomicrobiota bacterium]